ncbi:hypothetical protein PGB90_007424 [Kerria lacca]
MSKTVNSNNSSKMSQQVSSVENIKVSDEISDNEEILFELDECLHTKDSTLAELKEQVENLENDIKRYTTPYDTETGTVEEDITIFQRIASKYVKRDLVDFYVERIKKKTSNVSDDDDTSTVSALCELISKGKDL